MATVYTASCTPPDGCGWTGGPYKTEPQAHYALTARRLQALACLGWSVNRLADHAGLDRQPLDHALTGGTDVVRRTADAVARLYDELWNTPAPAGDHRTRISVSRTKTRASQAGWLPPLAWDDIDNPDEQPDTGHPTGRRDRTEGQVEDLADLAEHGLLITAAAARVGVTVDYARTLLRRHDRRDVLARYDRNDLHATYGRTA